MSLKIYLCGPMTGLTPEQASDWRAAAEVALAPFGFTILSPMRVEGNLLKPGQKIAALEKTDEPALQGTAVYHRDMFDLDRTDILLCNLNDVPAGPCIGSVFEIGYCAAKHPKPAIIVVARKGTAFRRHPIITTPAHAIFEELAPAYAFIIANFAVFSTSHFTKLGDPTIWQYRA